MSLLGFAEIVLDGFGTLVVLNILIVFVDYVRKLHAFVYWLFSCVGNVTNNSLPENIWSAIFIVVLICHTTFILIIVIIKEILWKMFTCIIFTNR